MPLRPPNSPKRPDTVHVVSPPPVTAVARERVTRPMPARSAPHRGPVAPSGSATYQRPPAPANPIPLEHSAVDAAYRVYDEYVEAGRGFAEGQSAWFNRDQTFVGSPTPPAAPPGFDATTLAALATTFAGALRQLMPAGAATDLLTAVARALSSAGGSTGPKHEPATRSGESGQWQRWLQDEPLRPPAQHMSSAAGARDPSYGDRRDPTGSTGDASNPGTVPAQGNRESPGGLPMFGEARESGVIRAEDVRARVGVGGSQVK